MNTKTQNITILKLIQFLSIDVVLGTLAVGYLATRILNVDTNPTWWIVLPMAVWVVYTLDHLVDGYKNSTTSIIDRHSFHYQNRKFIIFLVMVVSLITIVLSVIFLDTTIIFGGIGLAVLIGMYFLALVLSKRRKFILLQKEIFIAIVYTSGIFLAPLVWNNSLPSHSVIYMMTIISMLAWAEGIIISWFDFDYDIMDGHSSFTVIVGKRYTRLFIISLNLLIETSILVFLIFKNDSSLTLVVLLILLFMNLILGLLILFPNNPVAKQYHRLIGESVFLLPVLLVFV